MSRHTQSQSSSSDLDELQRYLMDSCLPVQDPLAWWAANRKLYPSLAKLAISVHAIPGTLYIYC